MQPKVSVVIPFYNCPYIDQAIESVLYQTYTNNEIIVVDDGSSAFVDLVQPYMPYIKYIRKPNGGTASALNTGIRNAAGAYIAWLSADDMYYTSKIAKQLEHMLQTGAQFSFTDFNVYVQDWNFITPRNLPPITDYKQFASRFIEECAINGCTVMMTKDLLNQVGLFDESLIYTQDYDLWVRILLSGCEMHFIGEALTLYRSHPEMGSRKHTDAQMIEFDHIKQKYRSELLHFIRYRKLDF